MLEQYRRVVPFILAGLLLFNLADAIANGGRANWIVVAVMALVLALTLWLRRPRDGHEGRGRQNRV